MIDTAERLHARAQFRLTGGRNLPDTSPIVTAALRAQQCGSHSEAPDARWYCAKVHPQREFEVVIRLQQQGFLAHLPLYVASRKTIRRPTMPDRFRELVSGKLDEQEDIVRALFPSYLFVQFDRTQDQWRSIASTLGVASLFMSSDFSPTPVARGVVENLIAKGRPGDGVIDDRYRGPEMPRDTSENDIQPGARVRITSGPFADVTGICTMSWQKRNELLIQALGGDIKVTVDRRDIQTID